MKWKVIPLLLVAIGSVLCHAEADADPVYRDALLWYKKPASRWNEALPLGNGRLGAMVYGGVQTERISLNEDTLWSGGPYEPSTQVDTALRAQIAQLLFAGKEMEAQKLADRLQGTPNTQSSYQAVGDLILEFPDQNDHSGYRRILDLDTALAGTSYTSSGVHFTRECLVSPEDQLIVLRLAADKPGALSLRARFASKLESRSLAQGADLVLTGRNGDMLARDKKTVVAKGALSFEARLRVKASGGQVRADGSEIVVEKADEVLLLVAIRTSFRSSTDVSGKPAKLVADDLKRAEGKSYTQLKEAHVAAHRALFARLRFRLPAGEQSSLPTDERLARFEPLKDPALVALHYQFGRYLLLCSSRPGGQPANLQGLWNDQLYAPWGGKYTVNINTQMNYWPSQVANLAETQEPLLRMLEEISSGAGARTAARTYGARGWVLHHNTDLWRAAAPIDTAFWGQWQTGGAWLAVQLHDAYRFSGDVAYLRRLYPILKGSAQFFQDTLIEEPEHGWLVTAPSNSPEHFYKTGVTAAYGPTMDMQILRDLLRACIQTSETLNEDAPLRSEWARLLSRLAPNQVGHRGQLQEWIKDWDYNEAPEPNHRHMSPLYGVYPGFDISPTDKTIWGAAKVLAERRAVGSMGWANAWRLCIWARLGNAAKAGDFVNLMLKAWTEPNLFDKPQTQLDGNFGFTAGVSEMLLQSQEEELVLHPAWPLELWPSGSVEGLRARGGFEVDLEWHAGVLERVRIRSLLGGKVFVRLNDRHYEALTAKGESFQLDGLLRRVGDTR